MNPINRKELFLILASTAAGVLSTGFCDRWPNLLALWSLMPFLCLEAESRRVALLTPFVFYLAISRGIVPGAYVFFQDGSLIRAFTLWISSAAALAAPWGLFWSERSPATKACGVVLAALASIPPPLGLIGWGNPLTGAGLFFPGFGWFGLVLMLDLYAEAAQSDKLRRAFIAIALLTVPFLTLPAIPERVTVDDVTIQSLNTSFGRVASGSGDFDAQYERERAVFQYISERKRNGELEGADIVILPETIIGRMNPTTLKRWTQFFEPFAQKGTIVIAGGEIPTDRGRKYDNVMISFEGGGRSQTARQRFPVLFSMFRPFSGEGANAYLSSLGGLSIMEVRGRKLGFLVCYEQFLMWPFLSLASRKPDVIIAPSNLWWCRDTSLPGIQGAAVQLWAAMFGVPLAIAVNL
jgi:apolipoprotein N-acyltransferase